MTTEDEQTPGEQPDAMQWLNALSDADKFMLHHLAQSMASALRPEEDPVQRELEAIWARQERAERARRRRKRKPSGT